MPSPFLRTFLRRGLPASAVLLGLVLSGCTGTQSEPDETAAASSSTAEPASVVLRSDHRTPAVFGGAAGPSSIAASAALFTSSPVAVVLAAPEHSGQEPRGSYAATAAVGLGVPLLVTGSDDAAAGPASAVQDELDRLGAGTAIVYGTPPAGWDVVVGGRGLIGGPENTDEFERLLGLGVQPTAVRPEKLTEEVAGLQREGELALLEPAGSTAPDPAASTAPTPDASASTAPVPPEPSFEPAELPRFEPATASSDAVVLATDDPAGTAAVATARAAGAPVRLVSEGDPRADSGTIDFLREHREETIYAVGNAFGGTDAFARHTAVALNAPELPGGGQTVFPGRRLVALYGHPSGGALGVLGEQDIAASVQRARETAAAYDQYSAEPVVPAFEIIATVASSDPGADGDYSAESTVEYLKPWVDAAEEAGVYVVLDLQPGYTDFLTQAKLYEELLKRPYVGLAVDPEWRLEPGQQHLAQIGSVDAAEINEVSTWLADLTRKNNLPQKVLVLHEFSLSMITNRDQLDVSRDELAMVLHTDGHGLPGQKIETWNALRSGLQEGIHMGWKNFYDEDTPTFTPEQTFTDVHPKPWFVSYQ